MTCFLRNFYKLHNEYRLVIKEVIVKLRSHGGLNSHGLRAIRGQSLKTVSLALWCAGLKSVFPHLCSEDDVFNALAFFNADVWIFELRHKALAECDQEDAAVALSTAAESNAIKRAWTKSAHSNAMELCVINCINRGGTEIVRYENKGSCSGASLLLLHEGRNSAANLTQPVLAHIQQTCWRLRGVENVPSPLRVGFLGCLAWKGFWDTRVIQHVRFRTNEDCPIVTVWPKSVESKTVYAFVVLAGNDNGIFYETPPRAQLVVVTWCLNYETIPQWLPDLMDGMMTSLLDCYGAKKVNLVGFSRGVQAFLGCVATGKCLGWLDRIGYVCLAGGCLWQRQGQKEEDE